MTSIIIIIIMLQSFYQGPFKVIDRQGKVYKLDIGMRQDTVSIDRLNPAFLEEANHAIEAQRPDGRAEQKHRRDLLNRGGGANEDVVPLVTSSGRLVRLPVR